jgi:hypothetical protein
MQAQKILNISTAVWTTRTKMKVSYYQISKQYGIGIKTDI